MGVIREVNRRAGLKRGSVGLTSMAPSRAGRGRSLLAGLLLVFSVVPFLGASVASAVPGVPARSSVLNSGGFPTWFQDVNGVRVEPCLDPALTNCLAPLPGPTYDGGALSFPGNYPDEFFYSAVDTQPVIVNDCVAVGAAANPGITAHLALEGAFINGAPAAGEQMVFGRIRLVAKAGSGLCGNTWYTFRTPYGRVTIQTGPDGSLVGGAAAAATIDVGCFPSPASPCNFNDTLAAPVLQIGLLQQAVGAAPGYLGDGSFAAIVGGLDGYNQFEVVKWPAGITPATAGLGTDCIGVDCTVLGGTANFSVLAKLAGPIAASATTLDFGGQVVGTTSTARSIDLTNLGSGALGLGDTVIDDVVVNGAGFALTSTNCSIGTVTAPLAATPLVRDASCFVGLSFTPSALGVATATLDIYANGSAVPFSVNLAGTGTNAGDAPGIATDPVGNVVIPDTRFRTVSEIVPVTVTNTGTAPLLAIPSIVASADSGSFVIASNTCGGAYVPAGQTCTVGIRFVPTHPGLFSELLSIQTNVPGAVIALSLNANASGGNAAVSATTDPVNTFPDWYQDEHGVRVGQCADPANTLCVAAPVASPLVFPSNYPDEWFYYIVQSAPLDVSDPVCEQTPGPLMVETAAEAAFLGPIAANEGITFGRLRIVSRGGLCPNTSYLFTHPYGRTVLSTDSLGDIKPAAGTTDVGCVAVPCDYTQALSATVFESFMEQTVRPGGYLGDPLNPSTATGSPYTDPATGLATNYFNIQRLDTVGQPDSIFGSTDQFTVSGRLVGPMVATPGSFTFPAAQAGLVADARTTTVTFTNDGLAPVAIDAAAVTIEGANAGDFTVIGGTCVASPSLAPAAGCTVDVQFLPAGTGNRSADLILHHNGKNSPLAVPLSGVGLAPVGSAALSSTPAAVQFIDLHQGEASERHDIVISNVGGQAPLQVGAPSVSLGGPFSIVANTCTTLVQPGNTCTMAVRFVPGSAAAFHGVLTVPGSTFLGATLPSLAISLDGKGVDRVPALAAASSAGGFPSWIQDNNGVRLEQCLQNDGTCVLLADATFNPALPVSFPSNYPVESFFSIADSEQVVFPGQACGNGTTSAGGFAQLRVATEAAFAGTTPAPGGQNLFNRIRITASGLCPNTSYQFVTPYGIKTLVTDAAGAVRPKDGTFDNANVTGSDPVLHSVLRWDPNVAPAAAAGFIGDPRTLHTVVGSVFHLLGDPEPVNYFQVGAPGASIARTDKFLVAGRTAGPVVPSVTARSFGFVQVGSFTTGSIVITNIGTTPVTNLVAAVTGAGFAFAPGGNGCGSVGLTLGIDESCTIVVRFAPTTAGLLAGSLTVGHSGLRSPVTVGLSGSGVPNQTPVLVVGPTTFNYGNVTVGGTASTTLQLKNSGTGPLFITSIGKTGVDAAQFTIVNSTCHINDGVALTVNNVCNVTATFVPASKGAKTASFFAAATDADVAIGHVPVTIPNAVTSLTGTGAQGTISSSATTVTLSGRTGNVTTSKLTFSNTGTAPFTVSSVTWTAVTGVGTLTKFSASITGCANVAVGRSCQPVISFTPGAGTVGETWSADARFVSNASNSPLVTRVNGTRSR